MTSHYTPAVLIYCTSSNKSTCSESLFKLDMIMLVSPDIDGSSVLKAELIISFDVLHGAAQD